MTDTELKSLCKKNLRLTDDNTVFDDQIASLITAAKDNVSQACDEDFDADNTIECQYVVSYVKAMLPLEHDEKAWAFCEYLLNIIGTRKL